MNYNSLFVFGWTINALISLVYLPQILHFYFIFCCPLFFFLYWSRVKSGLVDVGFMFGGAQIVCWIVSWAWWRISRGAFSLGRVGRWRLVPLHCNPQQLTRPPLSQFVTSRAPNRWSSHSVMRCHELPGTEKRTRKGRVGRENWWRLFL